MQICKDCKTDKLACDFYESQRTYCKACWRERVKANRASKPDHYREYDRERNASRGRVERRAAYARTGKGKEVADAARKKWQEANSDKRAAHVILGNAVRDGRIVKPETCQRCGAILVSRQLHAHHTDYALPLVVEWICSACHGQEHFTEQEARVDELLISTKDKAGTLDAFETAKPGEPLFTLQGGDPFAPDTVLRWVELARHHALKVETDDEKARTLLKRAMSAEMVAWAMQSYRRGEAFEKAEREAITAPVNTEDTLQLANIVKRLHNSIAEVIHVAEKLEAAGFDTQGMSLRDGLLHVSAVAESIEPRQHLRRS